MSCCRSLAFWHCCGNPSLCSLVYLSQSGGFASSVNAADQVVGTTFGPSINGEAFLWDTVTGMRTLGERSRSRSGHFGTALALKTRSRARPSAAICSCLRRFERSITSRGRGGTTSVGIVSMGHSYPGRPVSGYQIVRERNANLHTVAPALETFTELCDPCRRLA
jgi:hypothetical protein